MTLDEQVKTLTTELEQARQELRDLHAYVCAQRDAAIKERDEARAEREQEQEARCSGYASADSEAVKYQTRWHNSVRAVERLEGELEKARQALTDHDITIVALNKAYQDSKAELEQVKAERDKYIAVWKQAEDSDQAQFTRRLSAEMRADNAEAKLTALRASSAALVKGVEDVLGCLSFDEVHERRLLYKLRALLPVSCDSKDVK